MAVSFVTNGVIAANATTTTLAVVAPTFTDTDPTNILICAIHSNDNQVVTAPANWTKFVELNNTANQRLTIAWKRAAPGDSAATFNFTKPTDNNLLFCGVIGIWTGCVSSGNPIDATTPSTSANAVADAVTYADFDPTETAAFVVAVGIYADDATTGGAMSGTNPTFTKRIDVETAVGADASIFFYDGASDGSATGARSHATTSTIDAISIGCLFGLIAQPTSSAHIPPRTTGSPQTSPAPQSYQSSTARVGFVDAQAPAVTPVIAVVATNRVTLEPRAIRLPSIAFPYFQAPAPTANPVAPVVVVRPLVAVPPTPSSQVGPVFQPPPGFPFVPFTIGQAPAAAAAVLPLPQVLPFPYVAQQAVVQTPLVPFSIGNLISRDPRDDRARAAFTTFPFAPGQVARVMAILRTALVNEPPSSREHARYLAFPYAPAAPSLAAITPRLVAPMSPVESLRARPAHLPFPYSVPVVPAAPVIAALSMQPVLEPVSLRARATHLPFPFFWRQVDVIALLIFSEPDDVLVITDGSGIEMLDAASDVTVETDSSAADVINDESSVEV
jgi:hypothetical protein